MRLSVQTSFLAFDVLTRSCTASRAASGAAEGPGLASQVQLMSGEVHHQSREAGAYSRLSSGGSIPQQDAFVSVSSAGRIQRAPSNSSEKGSAGDAGMAEKEDPSGAQARFLFWRWPGSGPQVVVCAFHTLVCEFACKSCLNVCKCTLLPLYVYIFPSFNIFPSVARLRKTSKMPNLYYIIKACCVCMMNKSETFSGSRCTKQLWVLDGCRQPCCRRGCPVL